MYKVKALKDFGIWCFKGQIYHINNNLAEDLSRKGIVKIIRFIGNADGMTHSVYECKRRIESIKLQIDTLKKKKESYEIHLKHIQETDKRGK